ncbi:MAG: hypothetical protein EPN53_07185 [Acidobacteria bacterium]|nr:MAG: hypothetical protein EPN53_07185 [Acidobacteriota bacterium]
MRETTMKRNLFLVGLALGTAVTLVSCSQSSPTAPKVPTPVANTVSLTASPSVAGINENILLVAQIGAGSGTVADGTAVTFTTTIGLFENGKQEETRTTSGGRATATLVSLAGGDGLVTARVGSGSATAAVHFRGGSAAQLAITSVLPNRGKPQGGDQVVIHGQGFLQPLDVAFVVSGTSYPATVTAVAADGSSITVLTPQIPGGVSNDRLADVVVTLRGVTGAGGAVVSVTATGVFTYAADTGAPLLYSVVPATGSASGGDIIALTGKYFTEPIEVDFVFTDPNGGVGKNIAARVVDVQHGADGTDTAHVQTPRASTGTVSQTIPVDFTIKNQLGGNSQSNTFPRVFTYVPDVTTPPTIFYISPTYGSASGNETVVIYGRNFVQPVTVQFGSINESVQNVSDDGTAITVVTRPLTGTVPTAPVDVTVTTALGVATLPSAFTYLEGQTPQLYVLTPNLGPLEGGTRVTITGTGFQYPVQVLFGAQQAQVVSNNFNQVVCIAPSITASQPGTPTTVGVTVTNVGSGKVSNSLPYQYGQAMFISSVAPGQGPDTGGTQVTIFGQGFVGPLAVSLAGTPAQVLSVAGTQIVATSGAVTVRSCSPIEGPVSVTNIDSSTSASGGAWTYTPMNPLMTGVTSTCANGASTGCTITVTGSNFEPGMRIIFTNPPMTLPATFVSSGQLTATLTTSFEAAGINYRTAACGTGGTGVQKVATAIDVQVLNTSNKCTDTLPGALTIVPSDTSCVVPPVATTVTLAPTNQNVSAAATDKSTQFTITVTPTPAGPVNATITYAVPAGFFSASPATVPITNGLGVLQVTVSNTATSGQIGTIIASFNGANSAPATVTVTP